MSCDPIIATYIDRINEKKIDPACFALYTYARNNPLIIVDPNGLEDKLIVTHGTILKNITPKLNPDNYYKDASGNMNSEEFTDDVGRKLNIKEKDSDYVRWTGKNTKQDRQDAIKAIVDFVKTNYDKDKDTIFMMGHSHGANIVIEAADILSDEGYNIGGVFALNPPVREDYQPNGKYNLFYTYSGKDGAQWWGNTDFKSFSTVKRINGGHTFNSASYILPLDITQSAQQYFKNNKAPEGPFKYHQILRDFNFISNFIGR